MKIFSTLFLVGFCSIGYSQPNCLAFQYKGEETKYLSCLETEKCSGYYQFSKEFQIHLDNALAIDSNWAFPYKAKSTAYLKSGDFIRWKRLMDKAVHFDSKGNLGYRGWCRYQFFRDYKGAIEDIERLESLVDYDIGYSVNGDYHLKVAKALCYKALNQKEKAIGIIEAHIASEEYFPGNYDYLHLGVLLLEIGNSERAIVAFNQQQERNPLAESQYYLAQHYFKQENWEECAKELEGAAQLYAEHYNRFDPYTHPMDQIYASDLKKLKAQLEAALLK